MREELPSDPSNFNDNDTKTFPNLPQTHFHNHLQNTNSNKNAHITNTPSENNLTTQLSSFITELKLIINPLIRFLTTVIKKWQINKQISILSFFLFSPLLQIQGVDILTISWLKYLGMILDKRLTWGPHLKSKRKTWNNMLRLIFKSKLLNHTKSILYKSILRPIWVYAIQIWGSAEPSQTRTIQAFQSICLHFIALVLWYVTNEKPHKDLAIITVDQLAKIIKILSFWLILNYTPWKPFTLSQKSIVSRSLKLIKI